MFNSIMSIIYLWWLTIAYGYEPPTFSSSFKVSGASTSNKISDNLLPIKTNSWLPNHGTVIKANKVSPTAAIVSLVCQVDKLVVFDLGNEKRIFKKFNLENWKYLEHTFFVPARSQIRILAIDQRPLSLSVIVKVKVLRRIFLKLIIQGRPHQNYLS